MAKIPESAIARSALNMIADNITYIRSQVAALAMPDAIRALILSTCERFDPIVKWCAPDEPAGPVAPIADALAEMRDRVDVYVYGNDTDGLLDAIQFMHELVKRSNSEQRDDPQLHAVSMLVSESALNILNAYAFFHAIEEATEADIGRRSHVSVVKPI